MEFKTGQGATVFKGGCGLPLRAPPRQHEIRFRDIAKILSRIFRFNGHSDVTVAAHSVGVMKRLPGALAAYGLLHDAHEFWVGDITLPYQAWLSRYGSTGQYRYADARLKEMIDREIWRRFKLPEPADEDKDAIKRADDDETIWELNNRFTGCAGDPTQLMRDSEQAMIRFGLGLGLIMHENGE